MNEYELDSNTFMGGWFMPEDVIDSVLNWSKRNKHKLAPGLVSGGRVVKEYKDQETYDGWKEEKDKLPTIDEGIKEEEQELEPNWAYKMVPGNTDS